MARFLPPGAAARPTQAAIHNDERSRGKTVKRTAMQTGILLSLGLNGPALAEEGPIEKEITVTATREAQRLSETDAAIGVISAETVDSVMPGHPAEIMERVSGVHVNVTGGEGHMTAIRQPITTKALYLYLEDGIPSRSTGFFNHNALYELNLPQAGGIEVLKGPGTALYGSDAIGAVINVETRPAPLRSEARVSLEAGGHGWRRLLGSVGDGDGDDGLRADVNLTATDGWREATAYDRQALTLRWDRFTAGGATLKTVLSGSSIDQQTAGASRLLADDYETNPTRNYTPISYRRVNAVRFSVAWEKETADSLLSLTPYLRANRMDMLPNWSLSYDPVRYTTQHGSVGALIRYRKDYPARRARLILGLDLDHSPGSRYEEAITPVKDGRVYTDYTVDGVIYDYRVTYRAASPYVHAEFSPAPRLRLNLGLRYDRMAYDYDNRLGALDNGAHIRPPSTTVRFQRLSPKVGATWAVAQRLSVYGAYRQGFRVPSEGQLFRAGRNADTLDLKPVKAESFELGLHGGGALRYALALYLMRLYDDILTYRDTDTGDRYVTNAGETLHRGVEVELSLPFARIWHLDVAFSRAQHRYQQWSPRTGVDYSGNEMENAPRLVANTRIHVRPAWLGGGRAELEWVKLGSYWMDAANTHRYPGHDLLNLRVRYRATPRLDAQLRVMNLTDARYATSAKYTPASSWSDEKFEYAPGMPRTVYVGLGYRFR